MKKAMKRTIQFGVMAALACSFSGVSAQADAKNDQAVSRYLLKRNNSSLDCYPADSDGATSTDLVFTISRTRHPDRLSVWGPGIGNNVRDLDGNKVVISQFSASGPDLYLRLGLQDKSGKDHVIYRVILVRSELEKAGKATGTIITSDRRPFTEASDMASRDWVYCETR